MTHRDRWLGVIDAISPNAPEMIDEMIAPFEASPPAPGTLRFPVEASVAAPVYPFDAEETVTFAARVTEQTPDRLGLAMQLAQMALEKGAEAIIFSHVDDPALDRFGFRVERIAGRTQEERAAAEAQLVRFWNAVFVI